MLNPLKSRGVKPGDHVYLIDGSGYIFRAYHALPPLTRKSDGLPIGAAHGFCAMLHKLLRELPGGVRPTHLAVIFDKSEVTFRNELFDGYKANRPPPLSSRNSPSSARRCARSTCHASSRGAMRPTI